MPAKEFIVAIELGSTKITGIAGNKRSDGSINVLALAEEDSTPGIRKGMVYNIDKTSQILTNVVKKLKQQLKSEISQVYVGVGGQSIRSVKNEVVKQLAEEETITADMINEIMDSNRNMTYPDQEILDAITQEYKVGAQTQLDPVGIQAKRIEGRFLNILQRKSFYRSLNKCFDTANIAIAEMFLAPLAMAESVLTENELRGGCVLIDLGAETTTVMVYFKNILRHLVVIPIGQNNITKDIASLQMEENDAENVKLKYASAYTDINDIDDDQKVPVTPEMSIDNKALIDVVEARVQEIVENAWYQVPGEYKNKLLGGMVLTGGGSNMKSIKHAFRNHTHMDKIRIASTVKQSITSSIDEVNENKGMMCTAIGLLALGDMNCAGMPANKRSGELFDNEVQQTAEKPQATTTQPGRVLSAAERKALEDKQLIEKQQAILDQQRRELEEMRLQAEKEKLAEENKKSKKGRFSKFFDSLKDFGNKVIREEED